MLPVIIHNLSFEGLGAPGSVTTISDGADQTGPGATECPRELRGDISRRLFCRLYHSTRRMGKETSLLSVILTRSES